MVFPARTMIPNIHSTRQWYIRSADGGNQHHDAAAPYRYLDTSLRTFAKAKCFGPLAHTQSNYDQLTISNDIFITKRVCKTAL